jgi:hypothetical protein
MDSVVKAKRGPKPGILRDAPYFPDRVIAVIRMRKRGMTLREIGAEMQMTPAGVSHLINRWGQWAVEQGA